MKPENQAPSIWMNEQFPGFMFYDEEEEQKLNFMAHPALNMMKNINSWCHS